MKKNLLILVTLLSSIMYTGSLKAQREIQFSYDSSGNMISRTIYLPVSSAPIYNAPDTIDQEGNNGADNKDVYEDQLGVQQIQIYPNPTSGKLTVEIPNYKQNPKDRIDILDMKGTLKQRITQLSSSNILFLDSYVAGTYIMIIQINDQKVEWKIIKQ